MRQLSRRRFVTTAAVVGVTAPLLRAAPAPAAVRFDYTPGVQLYSVAGLLKKDFAGTLAKLAAMGYRQVELTDLHGKTAAEWKKALGDAGLVPVSIHHAPATLEKDLTSAISFTHAIGASYIICASPRAAKAAEPTLDEWKAMAAFLDKVGGECATASIRFGYHNHNVEFARHRINPRRNSTGFLEIMTGTNPDFVTWELDCGWAAAAGVDAIGLLARYRNRFALMHVKDIAKDQVPNYTLDIKPALVGQGRLDWKTMFDAARFSGVQDYFIELEPTAGDPLAQLKQSLDYIQSL